MKTVNSHLKSIVAQIEAREHRRIGIMTIVKNSGASRSTVQRLLNNTIKNVPLEELAKICTYLNCSPGDVLRLEDTN